VYCHEDAHILQDECGAPEFFGNGLRLVSVQGADGKLQAEALQAAVARDLGHGVHSYIPSTLSFTQSTECGTVYQPEEITALCQAATALDMTSHMDGARFANAVAALGCSPAEASWQAGVRLLSFGASKNGCLAAEALLIFDDPGLRERAERLRKRSGHLLSKMRFVSAQLLAYIEDDRWLEYARRANRQAARFANAVRKHPEAELAFSADANEIFVRWTASGFNTLSKAGVQFLTWPGHDNLARFVFSHDTPDSETASLCAELGRLVTDS
jgi:threonine aldolase